MRYRLIIGHQDGDVEFLEFDTKEDAKKAISEILDDEDVVYVEIEIWKSWW